MEARKLVKVDRRVLALIRREMGILAFQESTDEHLQLTALTY